MKLETKRRASLPVVTKASCFQVAGTVSFQVMSCTGSPVRVYQITSFPYLSRANVVKASTVYSTVKVPSFVPLILTPGSPLSRGPTWQAGGNSPSVCLLRQMVSCFNTWTIFFIFVSLCQQYASQYLTEHKGGALKILETVESYQYILKDPYCLSGSMP